MREKDLYPAIVRLLTSNTFGCFETFVDRGTAGGRVDVCGLRNIGGHMASDFQICGVEVKTSNAPLLKSIGQALAYTTMVDRSYLAFLGDFEIEDRDTAAFLGIGLIKIRKQGRGYSAHLEQESQIFTPMPGRRLGILRAGGFLTCQLCGIVERVSDSGATRNLKNTSTKVSSAIDQTKALLWYHWDDADQTRNDHKWVYNERMLCSNCVYTVIRPLSEMGGSPT